MDITRSTIEKTEKKELQGPFKCFMLGVKLQLLENRVTVEESSTLLNGRSLRTIQRYSKEEWLPNQSKQRTLLFKLKDVLRLKIYLGDKN